MFYNLKRFNAKGVRAPGVKACEIWKTQSPGWVAAIPGLNQWTAFSLLLVCSRSRTMPIMVLHANPLGLFEAIAGFLPDCLGSLFG